MQIQELGFNAWFQKKIDSGTMDSSQIARVSAVNKDNYLIRNTKGDTLAEVTGKLLFQAESPLDYPAVGDWVQAQYFDNNSFAIIDAILPRKSLLKRKAAGKKIDYQLIAANIDTAFVMQSLDSNFNLRRLERYLAMVNEGQIEPVILLSKSDLISAKALKEKVKILTSEMPDIHKLIFSNLNETDLQKIKKMLQPGKTYCLLGSSGVGKTTLLNKLIGEELFATQEVREKDSRGRHTTTRRQLHMLPGGAMIIDTPGMREIGHIGMERGLEETFAEIAALSKQCRFRDCSHTNEARCAVLAAVNNGTLAHDRYQSYLKMRKEFLHFELSYAEKRRQDKKLGKMYKSIIKNKKGKWK